MKLAANTTSYNPEQWKQGYQSQLQESDYWVDDIEGEIPTELEGTLFRNGPGLLDIHGTPIRHPFDGDGMVCAISFQEGSAHFRNRFVRTEAFVEEQEAGKILYRGVFGTQKPGGWWNNAFDFRLKNIANTNVIYWGGKLLALWEAAQPYRLDPRNLDTLGLDDLDGILQPGDAFAAHPWIDPSCQFNNGEPCLVNFAIKPGLSTTITVYELDSAGKLLRRHDHSVPGFAFIHDFAITPNYCLFFQNPVTFNPLPFLLGFKGAGECVNFQANSPTRIIVIPRDTKAGEKIKVLETQAGFVFHHANAFEENGKIYLDSICYDSIPQVQNDADYRDVDFATLAPGQLWRFTLDLEQKITDSQLLLSRCCEFPEVHPDYVGHSYRYLFIGVAEQKEGNAPLQGILKLDLTTGTEKFWSAAPSGFVSEPVFVPHPQSYQEDEGWILTLVYNGDRHRSELIILDASNLDLVAKLNLKQHIPYGLHGNWVPNVF
ncbi:MAG: carotenoid oxygenase family protein [Spirulinaceae cyanobacterium]